MTKSFEHYIVSRYPDEVAHYRTEEPDVPLYVLFPDEWHIWQFQQDTIISLEDQLLNERQWNIKSMGNLLEKEEGIGYMNRRIAELSIENDQLKKELDCANKSIMNDLFLLQERDNRINSLQASIDDCALKHKVEISGSCVAVLDMGEKEK